MRSSGAGLCGICRHARRIESAKGSVFLLCRLSSSDPRFARYPRLPVFACEGFAPDEPDTEQEEEARAGSE